MTGIIIAEEILLAAFFCDRSGSSRVFVWVLLVHYYLLADV